MKKKKVLILSIILITLLGLIVCLINPGIRESALEVIGIKDNPISLDLKVSDKDIKVGDEFDIEIYATTKEQAINAVGFEIKFDEKLVEVLSTSTQGSICELFPEDVIDNNSVRYSCGLPSPGFVGEDGLIGTITVKSIDAGGLDIGFEKNSQMLANDGLGTDLLTDTTNLVVTIKPV